MGINAEFKEWLRALPKNVQAKTDQELRSTAETLAAAIRAAVPVGKTGNLARSVRVTRREGSHFLLVEAGGELTTKTVREGYTVPSKGRRRPHGKAFSIVRGQSVRYDYA